MYYYRSTSRWLFCMGIICVFIGFFNGPLMGVIGYYYIMAGGFFLIVGGVGVFF